MLSAVVVAAIVGNYGLRTGVSSLAGSAAAVGVVAVLRSAGRRSRSADLCLGTAIAFALLLPWRASPWLTGLNAAAVAISLAGCVLIMSGFRFRLTVGAVVDVLLRGFPAVFGPQIFARSFVPRRSGTVQRALPVLRGLALAALPVLILGALLASADSVFAEAVSWDIDLGEPVGHVALILLLAVALSGLLAVARSRSSAPTRDWRPLGAVEAAIVLCSVGLLFAVFSGVQLYSALGRADEILARQGVSYAEYARGGFFQLLWVATLTALGLAGIRGLVEDAGDVAVERARLVRWLGAGVSLLTCVIVATAVVRLDLYTEEFGLTTLRWYSTAFAILLGIAFLMIAVAHAPRLHRRLPIGLALLVGISVIVVNLMNPEARVAEHNLARGDAATKLDADYLLGLSADAWPILLDNEETVVANLSGRAVATTEQFAAACRNADLSRGFGPAGFNAALSRLTCD